MTSGNNEIPIVMTVDSSQAKAGADQASASLDKITASTKTAAAGVDGAEKSLKTFGATAATSARGFDDVSKSLGGSGGAASLAAKSYAEAAAGLGALDESTVLLRDAQAILNAQFEAGAITATEYKASVVSLGASLDIAAQQAALFGKVTAESSAAQKEATAVAGGLTSGLAALGIAFGGIEVLKSVDQYNQLNAKLQIITQSTGDYIIVQDELLKASEKTGTSFEGNVRLFQQLSIAAKNLGANNSDITKFVENFDKVGAIFKLDASHLNATILDLSHSLEQGTVKAQQLNKLMLAFPALIPIITPLKGEFNTLAEALAAGAVKSKDLFDVLQKGLAEQAKSFDLLPPAISRAAETLKTAFTDSFANLLNNTGVVTGLANSLLFLADNSRILTSALAGVAVIAGGAGIAALVGLFGAATPLIVALTALASAAAYFSSAVDETKKKVIDNNAVLKQATQIQIDLNDATGKEVTALENKQKALKDTTSIQLAFAQAELTTLETSLALQNLEQERANKAASKPTLRPGEIDITSQVAAQNGYHDAAGIKPLIDDKKADIVRLQNLITQQTNLENGWNADGSDPDASVKPKNESDGTINDRQKNIAFIQEEIKQNTALLAAKKDSVTAFNNTSDAINAENAARQAGFVIGTDEADQYIDLYKKNQDLLQGIKDIDQARKDSQQVQKEYNSLLKEFGYLGQANAGQLANQRIEQFKLTAEYQNASPAFQKYIDQLEDEGNKYNDSEVASVKAYNALRKFNDEYKKTVEAQAKPFVQAAEDIQRGLESSIENGIRTGFKKGEDPVKAFANVIKDTLIKTLSSALAAEITNQFVKPMISNTVSMFNNNPDVQNSVNSQFGISGGATGGNLVSSLLGGAKTAYGIYNQTGQSGGLSGLYSNYFGGASSASGTASGLGSLFTSGSGGAMGLTSAGSDAASIGSFSGLGASGSLAGAGTGTGGVAAGFGGGLGADFGLGGGAAASGGATAASGAASSMGSAVPIAGALISAYTMFTAAQSGHKEGPLAGGAQGAMLGASIAGPWGAVVGGIIGAIAGSLGPSHPKVKASEFQSGVANDNLIGTTYGSKGMDTTAAKGLTAGVNSYLSSLSDLGINTSNSQIRGAVNSNQGNKFDVLGKSGLSTDVIKSFSFDPSNNDSVAAAIASVGVELAKGANVANKSLNIALQNIKTTNRSAADITSDLAFAAAFDTLGQAPKVIGQFQTAAKALVASFADGEEKTNRLGLSVSKYKEYETTATKQFFDAVINPAKALSPLQQQLVDLGKTFDDLRAAAKTLGYDVNVVNAAQQVATAQVAATFNAGIASQIQQIVDPTAYAIAQLDAQFAVMRSDAVATGGDLVAVNKLYALQLANINAQAQSQALNAQKSFLNSYVNNQISAQNTVISALQNTQSTFAGLATSLTAARNGLLINPSMSNLSPQQQLAEAKRQYEQTLAAAKGGDQTAIGGLDAAGQAFLTASKTYNASSTAYFTDLTEVLNGLQDTASYAQNQVSIASQQLSVQQQQLAILQSIADKTSGSTATSALLPANPNQKFGKNLAQSQALAAVTNYRGDFGSGGFQNYIMQAPTDEQSRARAVIYSYGGVPAFASGGDFNGGLRIVGEHGAELEATGASRIYNAGQTKNILAAASGGDNRTADGVDNLVMLSKSRMRQSAAETNALRADMAALKHTNDILTAKIDRILSKAR